MVLMDGGGQRPKKGSGSLKKPHSFYGVGSGKQHTGAGSKTYKPAPYKPKPKPVAKKGRSMRTQVVDVYGSGSGSGGDYGKRSSGYGGGYGGGGGGYQDYYAQQRAAEEAEKKARLASARSAAEQELKTQMAMIDAAIKSANSQFQLDADALEARRLNARADVNNLYQGALGDTRSLNAATNADWTANQQAAANAANSLVGSIGTRNDQTEAGLSQALNSMGLGQGLQQDQVQAAEQMALAETQAQGNVANVAADYGLLGGAQRSIGDWNVSGLKQDNIRAITDIQSDSSQQIADLRKILAELLAEQERNKLRTRGDYRVRMAELDY